MKKYLLLSFSLSLSLLATDYYYEYGKKVEVTKLNQIRTINNQDIKYYMTSNGHKVGVNDEIIVQCQDNINCQNELEKYSFLKISKLSKKLFLVKASSGDNIFKISQELYSNDAIKLAHPNFIKNRKRR
jgi:hypothetical protein